MTADTPEARTLGEELLPCPFCGGNAKRYDDHDTGSINEGMSCIECTKCHACSAMHGNRKENLVDSWNNRTQPGAPSPEARTLGEDNRKAAEEFCKGAFGPFVTDVSQYIDIVAELMDHATERASSSPEALRTATIEPVADQIISQIEERFPDWKGFRDLVDCIDVTLHRLRGGS